MTGDEKSPGWSRSRLPTAAQTGMQRLGLKPH